MKDRPIYTVERIQPPAPILFTSCPPCPDFDDCGGMAEECPALTIYTVPLNRSLAHVDMRTTGVYS